MTNTVPVLKQLLESVRLSGHVDPLKFARVVFDADTRLAVLASRATAVSNGEHSAAIQDYVQAAATVLTKAIELNSDESAVLKWFNHERLRDFGSLTPAEMISSGCSGALLSYLESIEAGFSG